MIELEELISSILKDRSPRALLKNKQRLINLHARLAEEETSALTEYAQIFQSIKEEAYKITISETEKQAGIQTGYRFKKYPALMETIREAISLIDDMFRLGQEADLECLSQISPGDVLEPSS